MGIASVTGVRACAMPISISGITAPLTLSPGQSTSFSATFSPTTAGSASGSVSISSSAPGSPLTLALSGTGVQPQLSATPSSAAFGSVITGNSASQTITLKNTGTASTTISQATVTGTGFSIDRKSVV